MKTRDEVLTWLACNIVVWPVTGGNDLPDHLPELPDGCTWYSNGCVVGVRPKNNIERWEPIKFEEWNERRGIAMPPVASRVDVLCRLRLRLPSWPTNIREAEGLDDCCGWLWTMINGLPAVYCPTKGLGIHRGDWSVGRVAPAALPKASFLLPKVPLPFPQHGDKAEVFLRGGWSEALTIGPNPSKQGFMVFVVHGELLSLDHSNYRCPRTECEKVVSAALEHLGYDVTEFKFDGTETNEVCVSLVNLFNDGYLNEPKS